MIFSGYRQARSNVLVGEAELHFPVLWVVFTIVDVAVESPFNTKGITPAVFEYPPVNVRRSYPLLCLRVSAHDWLQSALKLTAPPRFKLKPFPT